MDRRTLLLGGGVLFTSVAGCLTEGAFRTGNEDRNNEEQDGESTNGQAPTRYYVLTVEQIEADELDTETHDVCLLDDLSETAQGEVKRAIEEGEYRTTREPAFASEDCYRSYIRYDGAYYLFPVLVASG